MEQTLDFCRNKVLKNAIIDSVELLKSGKYDDIKNKIDKAMTAGAERNVGHEYVESVEERYNQATRHILPTGWEVIDNLMDGGLGRGELGVVVAPAGIGKSFLLVNLGANVIKKGKNVLHYTLELNEAYVGLRYDSVITGIANQELKYNIDTVKDTVKDIKGNLVIKYYPTKTAAISTIFSHVERYKMLGKEPDMVIVDYADLLRGSGGTKEYRLELGNIYEELRGLAGQLEVPVWTASQANRSALQETVIQADKIAESYSKIMTADFVMSLSRKIEDKVAGTGRIHVIKNRFGPDGITFPSQINTNNGSFEIFDEKSVKGAELKGQMANHEEYLRKEMKKRFEELDD
jgi:replicative DNA helicase